MPKHISVGSICENLADVARAHGLKSLSTWLKLATNEAYLHNLMTQARADERIGVWDWDVGNNVNYLNAVGGAFFGKTAEFAARGAPTETYTAMICPDDAAAFHVELKRSITQGGPFFSEYRVITDGKVRWLRADGNCTLNDSGTPSRMLGSMVDITREKSLHG